MKKLLFILIIPLLITNWNNKALGQDLLTNTEDNETKTVFSDITVYGGPELKLIELNDELGVMFGGRGGTIYNDIISIGGAAYLLLTSHRINNFYDETSQKSDVYFRTVYGGLFLEYTNSPKKLIHFTVNSLVGVGFSGLTGSLYCNNHNDNWIRDVSGYFIFEPGAAVELNITEFWRLSLGASYRIISGLDLRNDDDLQIIDNNYLEGFSFNIIFKFGFYN